MRIPERFIKLMPEKQTLKLAIYDNDPEGQYLRDIDSDDLFAILYYHCKSYSDTIQNAINLVDGEFWNFDVDYLPF